MSEASGWQEPAPNSKEPLVVSWPARDTSADEQTQIQAIMQPSIFVQQTEKLLDLVRSGKMTYEDAMRSLGQKPVDIPDADLMDQEFEGEDPVPEDENDEWAKREAQAEIAVIHESHTMSQGLTGYECTACWNCACHAAYVLTEPCIPITI